LLWRAIRFTARILIRFAPAPAEAKRAAAILRDEVESVPGGALDTTAAWSRHRAELRRDILSKDPRAFLTWDVIADTMSPPPYARFVRTELEFLKTHNWASWRPMIRGRCLGYANAVHQCYHLCRFEEETATKFCDCILEFGAGYGEMRRIVHELGFGGRYMLFDLPEQNALQRYYLSTHGNPPTMTASDLDSVRAWLEWEPPDGHKLFIATWSLDETPMEVRERWANLLDGFDAFLIAYQAEFAGIDNRAFFADWQKRFPGIRWTTSIIPQLKDSFYLFGVASS
jgi:hypothetical protein